MTKHGLLFILIFFISACNESGLEKTDDSNFKTVDSSNQYSNYQQPEDSIDVQYIPIYNSKTKSTSKYGPVFQALLDSLLQYNKIRSFISDSSASVYILNELQNGADTSKKTISGSANNISAAICNFDKEGCYLQIKFDYTNKSTIVINSCNGQDSLQLYEWNKKNCW